LISGFRYNRSAICFLGLGLASIIWLLFPSSTATTQTVYATTASQIKNQVFAQDSAGEEYELKLRAIEEDGRIDTVPGFTLTTERVPQIDEGKDLIIAVRINDATTGQLVPDSKVIGNIKITDPNTGQIIKEVKPTGSNVFGLLGVKPGIYQLDAIVQLTDDTNGAYEGVLTILAPGQNAPPADQIRNVQNTVITRNPDPVFIPVPVGVPVPVPTTPVSPPVPPQPLTGQQAQPPQPLTGQQAQPPQPLTGQQAQPPQPLTGQLQPLNPASPPVDPCIENPDLPECQLPPPVDPCIENPDPPECQLPPPVDPCIENPDLPECQPSQALTPLGGSEPATDSVEDPASSGQSDTNGGISGEGQDTGESEGESEGAGDGEGGGDGED
jgi:hypothetical protein